MPSSWPVSTLEIRRQWTPEAAEDEKGVGNSRKSRRQFRPATSLSHSLLYALLRQRRQARYACRGRLVAPNTENLSQSESFQAAKLSQRREGSAPLDKSNCPQRKSGSPCQYRAGRLRACW